MAEAVKAVAPAPAKSGLPKVLSLRMGEGGIYLGRAGNPTELPSKGDYAGLHSALKELSMELDRGLGGVVLRYVLDKQPHTILVPMGNIRQLELAE